MVNLESIKKEILKAKTIAISEHVNPDGDSLGSLLSIDHHEFRRPFGNIKLIDIDAASVGEMIHLLLKKLNIKITEDIALNLLTSIIVEIDSFQLPNVTDKTFKICSELLEKKIDFHKLVNLIFWSQTKESLLLAGICFLRFKFLKKNQLVWSIITKKDFAQAKGKDEDVDAVADQMRSIKEVKIAVLFREKENNHIRVSLRSKGKINVAAIAEKFNGGRVGTLTLLAAQFQGTENQFTN